MTSPSGGGFHRAGKGVAATFENWTGFGKGEKAFVFDPDGNDIELATRRPGFRVSFPLSSARCC